MTISYDDAWKWLPFGHPDKVGDLTLRFAPTPQWQVLAEVAKRWRGLTPESPMREVGDAMAAFADRYPEIVEKIEREIPVSVSAEYSVSLTDFMPQQ